MSPEDKSTKDKAVSDKLATLLTAQTALNTNTDKAETDKLRAAVEAARKDLAQAQQDQSQMMDALNKFNMANGDSKQRLNFHLDNEC